MIYLTHDIDWLTPWHPLSLIKRITHGKRWLGLSKGWNPNTFLQSTANLIQLHQSNTCYKPVWFIGASGLHTYTRYGLRYRYDDSRLAQIIQLLQQHQCNIGLHSIQQESIPLQTKRLHALTGTEIQFHRSHFLRFDTSSLFHQLAEAGIHTDFSMGMARSPEYPPPTATTNTSSVKSIPTILFDNAFFFHPPEYVFNQFKKQLAALQGNDAAIVFHPENMMVNPQLHTHLLAVIRIIQAEGIPFYH